VQLNYTCIPPFLLHIPSPQNYPATKNPIRVLPGLGLE